MASPVVETQRLYRQIAEQLRRLIQEGEFAVGARLPAERDLAQQLGVSRPSVREAVIALEVEGVIEVRTGSGIYVCASAKPRNTPRRTSAPFIEDWGPLEVLRARLLIEPEIAALAATHAKPQQVKAMSAALQQMRTEAAQGQQPRHGDEAFHLAVAQACGNSVLLDTIQRYWRARSGPLFQRLGDYFENPHAWVTAIAEHEQVNQAIRAQDAQAARRAMHSHLRLAHKRYSASLRSAPAR